MTRIEVLTLRLLDQTISEAEVEELEQLVERAGPGVNDHFLLLDIEALLRGQAPPDLSAQVMDRLEAELTAQARRGRCCRTIAGLPAPAWKDGSAPPGRRGRGDSRRMRGSWPWPRRSWSWRSSWECSGGTSARGSRPSSRIPGCVWWICTGGSRS